MNLSGNNQQEAEKGPAQSTQPIQPQQAGNKSPVLGNLKARMGSIVSLLIVGLVFLLVFFAGYFAYQQYLRIDILKRSRTEKNKELEKVTAHANYLKNLSSLQDQLDVNMDLAAQAITLEHEIPQLMNQLLQIAELSNLEVESLVFAGSTTESTGTKTPGTINVQLDIKGDYDDIRNFLATQEMARRLNSIKSIKYESVYEKGIVSKDDTKFIPNDDLNEGDYELSIIVASFYLGEVDATNLDYSVLINQQEDIDKVVEKLNSMTWYEPSGDIENLQVGTSNPFDPDKQYSDEINKSNTNELEEFEGFIVQ